MECIAVSGLLDPVQKKMRELEYITTKLLSPFSALKSPSFSYGGGSPVYSVGGGSGYNYGVRYPSYVSSGVSSYSPSNTYSVPQYKPTNKFVPSYNTINWLGKGSSGLNYQQTTSNYAPDCFYPTSLKGSAAFVPSKFTYSKGTPLYVSHSSAIPSQTYGAPQGNFAKSTVSSVSGSLAPAISQPSAVSSGGFLIKTSVTPQIVPDGLPPSSSSAWSSVPVVATDSSSLSWSTGPIVKANPPSASWSTVSGYYPSAPSAPSVPVSPPSAAWSSVPNYYPTGPAAPSVLINSPSASWATASGNFPSGPSVTAIKASPPTNSWSTVPGYYPSAPQAPTAPANPPSASWSTVSNYYPSGPALPSVPANPSSASFATVSNYYPQGPPAPAGPSWSYAAGNYPTSGQIPQAPVAPSIPSPPSWSSVSLPSTPQPPQAPPTPSPPYWSTFGNAIPTPPPPAPQQYVLLSSTPAPAIEQDQKEENPPDEVVITPSPLTAKGNTIASLPGPQIALPQEPLYYPGSNYALSYYPNVFVITNEQHLDQPLSEESVKPSTESSTVASTSSAGSTTSTESSPSLKSQPTPEVTLKPALTSVHSSLTNERSKGPLFYSIPQPPPPVSSIFYSPPQAQNTFPVPVNFGASSVGSPQLVQSVPPTRTLLNPYPTSLGYSYSVPSVGVQPLPLPLPSTKSLAPC